MEEKAQLDAEIECREDKMKLFCFLLRQTLESLSMCWLLDDPVM
jgi:hypothetical protein